MQISKRTGAFILAAVLVLALVSSCRRGQGCPKFEVEITK